MSYEPKRNPLNADKPTRWGTAVDVNVNGNDTRFGVPFDPMRCAGARACVRQIDGCVNAWIGRTSSYLEFEHVVLKYSTPRSLSNEVVAYDRGGRFLPGTYTLADVPPSGRKPRTKGKRRGSGGGNPRPVQQTVGVRRG